MIDQFGMETVDAVAHLIKANHYLQALVVLYSAVDTLAWSGRTGGDVTRTDFCDWVSQYMKPESQLGCSPQDLYAARCALLHSSAAESKLSREGKVSELWYATSLKSVPKVQAYADQMGSNAKVVYFTALVAAFSEGAMKFSEELAADEKRSQDAIERIRRWIRFVPSTTIPGSPQDERGPAV